MTLSERERYIHYLSVLSCFGIMEEIPRTVILNLAEDIRNERCRKLSDEDVVDIVEEMKAEQMAGKTAMEEIMRKGFGFGETREDWR
tara:strand:+ start:565 stop:825 length:261 start_codon:yes stop_codon:yes gene_type:complete